NQWIMEGVVAGIAGYGNCIGVPTIGGEIHFHDRYSNNPLVNVFCLGIAPADRIFRATASGVGNPVLYVGARTGRDGIHGATMASEQFSADSESKRPTVQVGDPFMGKLLLEACLEAMKSGAIVGIQDMGAAGLTCSTCEMGAHAGLGVSIDLRKVPQRESGMTPYEIMLSESQERMLLVAEQGREDEVIQIFRKWDLEAVVIGEVRETPCMEVYQDGQKVADILNDALTDEAPVYNRPTRRPRYLEELQDWRQLDLPEPEDYNRLLESMLSSPHLSSRGWVYEQYDHMVRTDTVLLPGHDAAVLRSKNFKGALAMSLDSNARFSYLDPRMGAHLAVAECCRNLVCSGAKPLAATNNLNFASPENPEIMWQFVETVEGLAEACRIFGTPITGGNVSFYNETNETGILPTPVLGIVGKIEEIDHVTGIGFRKPGDHLFLLGETRDDLGGSIYLEVLGLGLAAPCPVIDLDEEKRLQEQLLAMIRKGLLVSAHDLSEGGLACALAESCLVGNLGAEIHIGTSLRADHFLFSETPSRVLVSVDSEQVEEFLQASSSLPLTPLGKVAESSLQIKVNDQLLVSNPITELRRHWDTTFDEVFRH
ncbi:MAG TPA: phosphoribosylformylglycinamidine synthase subunit PurL, partial [Acidobacteriota bacterium]|nr:phosphoribosylformylglycinamidine synthase subunit PurL [Acidobacteriota bacterium]